MILVASCSLEFDRDGNAGRCAGSEAKEKPQTDAEADSEHDRVRYRPGNQPQRTVLAAQQVVSEIKTPEHIEAGAGNTDGCDDVVVHETITKTRSNVRRSP